MNQSRSTEGKIKFPHSLFEKNHRITFHINIEAHILSISKQTHTEGKRVRKPITVGSEDTPSYAGSL